MVDEINTQRGETSVFHRYLSYGCNIDDFFFNEKAKNRIENLSSFLMVSGTVPSLSKIPGVLDPDKILSSDELRLHPFCGANIDQRPFMNASIAAVRKLMPKELKYGLHEAYCVSPSYLKDYVDLQANVWMPTHKHFLALSLGREPTNDESIESYINNGISIEYRLWFALMYPYKMRRLSGQINLNEDRIQKLFSYPLAA